MKNDFSNNGLILVDKPAKISSFGVVKKIRFFSNEKKVGHAGTLDPLASGLMIILVGKKNTKKADQFLKLDKVYEVEAKLGEISSTGDSEGKITKISTKKPSKNNINSTLKKFIGDIEQIPPKYSAIKIGGMRAYKLARRGKNPEIPSRIVKIYDISKVSYKYPLIKFEVKVSSGTYIRSLVEDIGNDLETGAYTFKLRRIKIGEYDISNSIQLDKIKHT